MLVEVLFFNLASIISLFQLFLVLNTTKQHVRTSQTTDYNNTTTFPVFTRWLLSCFSLSHLSSLSSSPCWVGFISSLFAVADVAFLCFNVISVCFITFCLPRDYKWTLSGYFSIFSGMLSICPGPRGVARPTALQGHCPPTVNY